MPPWAKADRIADEQNLSALESFWKLFAARYRGRNVIFAYDLRNEPEVQWDTALMREKWNRWLEQRYGTAGKLVAGVGRDQRSASFGTSCPRRRASRRPAAASCSTTNCSAKTWPTTGRAGRWRRSNPWIRTRWSRWD